MMTHYPNHCTHQPDGPLCQKCQADADEDPLAWSEYGNHPAGLERFRREQAEYEAERAALGEPDPLPDDFPL
jgi:hypothetical protein